MYIYNQTRKRIMQIKFNKKAVSPLIATVLLIAFAVSLGAVLLTYMSSLGECGGVSIQIAELNEKPQICYNSNTNKLDFTLENSGHEDIEYLKLTLTGALNVDNIDVDQSFPQSEAKKVSIDYKFIYLGQLQKLKIVPVTLEDNEETICPTDKSLEIEYIPEC